MTTERIKRRGFKCWYRLCDQRVEHQQQYCSATCQQTAKREAAPPEPHYAPLRVHTGRQAFHTKHSTDNRS